jgi:hypothetical protein
MDLLPNQPHGCNRLLPPTSIKPVHLRSLAVEISWSVNSARQGTGDLKIKSVPPSVTVLARTTRRWESTYRKPPRTANWALSCSCRHSPMHDHHGPNGVPVVTGFSRLWCNETEVAQKGGEVSAAVVVSYRVDRFLEAWRQQRYAWQGEGPRKVSGFERDPQVTPCLVSDHDPLQGRDRGDVAAQPRLGQRVKLPDHLLLPGPWCAIWFGPAGSDVALASRLRRNAAVYMAAGA